MSSGEDSNSISKAVQAPGKSALPQFQGLLLLDKPSGISSHDLVARVRRIMGTSAVGHCGTLDPLATGLMVLLINEATKLSQYILEKDKSYIVDLKFGITTDSFDSSGNIVSESPRRPSRSEVENAIQSLKGLQALRVPSFSAIKVNGVKLYEKARKGESFEPPQRDMCFYTSDMIEYSPDAVQVAIACSKGTYIRSWVDELGRRLGCGAMMTGLRRTSSDPYSLSQTLTLEGLSAVVQKSGGFEGPGFVPIEAVLSEVKIIRVKGSDEVMLGNGLISHDLRARLIQAFNPEVDKVIRVMTYADSKLLALIGLDPGKGFAIKRVLKY